MDNNIEEGDIDAFNCIQLRKFLRRHNQYVSGTKETLVKRAKGVFKLKLKDTEQNELHEQECVQRRKTDKLVTPSGINLPDPKTIKTWTSDLNEIPTFSESDIYNYLVLKMNCKRQLRSKVYLEDKHVHSVTYHSINESEYCFVRCKVIPSLPSSKAKDNPDHDVWLCLSKVTGQVHSAECDCTIGMAESCNHIGAFLYTLVAISEKKKDGTLASTSKKCEWNDPRKRKLSPKKAQDLMFKKTKFEKNSKSNTTEKNKQPPNTPKSSLNPERLATKLQECNPRAGWLLNFVTHSLHSKEEELPNIQIPYMFHDSVDLSSLYVKTQLEKFLNAFSTTEQQAEALEIKTRGQSKNFLWKDHRSTRITSSNFGRIIHMRESTSPESTIRDILYSDFRSTYTEWGKKHEAAARVKYQIHMKKEFPNVKIDQTGLIVSTSQPYLGASPDGIVSYKDKEGILNQGLIEIKCPAAEKWKNTDPIECAKDKDFYCTLENQKCMLKKSHNYYFQVQGQLAITGYKWCDFVVWTLKGMSVERITFDEECWGTTKSKLRDFYLNCIMPELFSQRIKRGKKLFN